MNTYRWFGAVNKPYIVRQLYTESPSDAGFDVFIDLRPDKQLSKQS